MIKLYASMIILIFTASAAYGDEILNKCLSAPLAMKNVSINKIEFLDDFRLFSYRNLSFGYDSKLESGVVIINNKQIYIDSINFSGYGKKVGREDVDLLQAELYLINSKKIRYFCINAPFSGIGKSGSLQNIRAAMLVKLNATKPEDILGLIGDMRK